MTITYSLRPQDYWRLTRYVLLHSPRYLFNIVLMFLFPPAVVFAIGWFMKWEASATYAGMAVAFVVWSLIYPFSLRRGVMKNYPEDHADFKYPHTVEISSRGLRETTEVNDSFYAWEGMMKLTEDRDYLYFFLDPIRGYIIPKREFASKEEAGKFMEQAMRYWKEAKEA